MIRIRIVMVAWIALVAIFSNWNATVASAQQSEMKTAEQLAPELKRIVLKHYPKAVFEVKENTLHFEFNTRKFMIHEALLTGEWQDAFEEIGPQKSGIFGTVTVQSGPYQGMAAIPQTFDKRYFKLIMNAPYNKLRNQHMMVHLKVPNDVKKEFLQDFNDWMDSVTK